MLDTTARVDPASLFDDKPLCEHCRKPFEPRARSGGSPQRFCNSDCRAAFHNTEAQRGQRSPACDAVTPLPAVIQPAEKPAPAAMPKDFDWANDKDIVLREQASIAIYRNKYDGLVIRQEARYPDEDEDRVIIIACENIAEFVDRLTDVAGIPSFP